MIEINYKFSPWISFKDQEIEVIEQIKEMGLSKQFKEDGIIINSGEYINGLFLLVSGKVIGSVLSSSGTEKTIFILEPFCFFGETLFFNNSPSNAEIKALKNSEIVFLNSEIINILESTNKVFIKMLLKSFARKAQLYLEQIKDALYLSPEEKVYKMLSYLAMNDKYYFNNKNTKLKITQEQLANLCGMHRVTVARVCNRLKSKGIIEKPRGVKLDLKLNISKTPHPSIQQGDPDG